VGDPEVPPALRDAVAQALAEIDTDASRNELLAALGAAPQQLQLSLAMALAGHPKGAESLLGAVEKGKASPRLLVAPPVRERLKAANVQNLDSRIAALTKGMVPASEETQKLIDQRRAAFAAALASPDAKAKPSAERGLKVFTTNCAACHRVGNEGATVGPQLDGLGKRGADRIFEDVLDPSRNVDAAFRPQMYQLKDGQTIAGLLRRKEGELIVIADSAGKEISFPESQVKRAAVSGLSLMPGNFGEVIPPGDLNDLVAFLLSK
jgi:putative heme-binding domain-containing protein